MHLESTQLTSPDINMTAQHDHLRACQSWDFFSLYRLRSFARGRPTGCPRPMQQPASAPIRIASLFEFHSPAQHPRHGQRLHEVLHEQNHVQTCFFSRPISMASSSHPSRLVSLVAGKSQRCKRIAPRIPQFHMRVFFSANL